MCAPDADPDRGGDEVPFVAGEVETDAVGLLGAERVEHGLEVGQRARREVVARRGVRVELVEGLEVGAGAVLDLDPQLGGLLDVAAPLLVHALEYVVLAACCALGVDERDLEVVLRLPGREAARHRLRSPPRLAELRDDAGADLAALGGLHAGQRVHRVVRDPLLDLGRAPAPGDDRRTDAHPEGTLAGQVLGHRLEPGREALARPVDQRTLGEVGEVALEPRELPVEDECGADDLGPVRRDPAD